MRVEIDSHSGFCFGVVRAISRAEEALQEQGEVFSLGDIVHNRVEVLAVDLVESLFGKSTLMRVPSSAHGSAPGLSA